MNDIEDFTIANIDDLVFEDGTSIIAGHTHILFYKNLFHVHDHKVERLSEALSGVFIKAAFHAGPGGHVLSLPHNDHPQVRLPNSNTLTSLCVFAETQARAEMRHAPQIALQQGASFG